MSMSEAETYRRRVKARDHLRDTQAALEEAVAARVQAGNADAIEALRELVNWVPEGRFPLERGVYDEDPDDPEGTLHDAPFCCEGYTYALLGKGDARSFLGSINAIARGLGLDGWRDLRGEAHL